MKKLLLSLIAITTFLSLHAQEDCGNGRDDDGDLLIDCDDPDCTSGAVPTGAKFNTAINGAGVLPGGSSDQNWEVCVGSMFGRYFPAIVMKTIPGSYAKSDWTNCDWISFSPTGAHLDNIDYYFKINFLLPCKNNCGDSYADSGNFCLFMDFYCDNFVDEVYINGKPQSDFIDDVPCISSPYYCVGFEPGTKIAMSLCQDWKPGMNELIIKVTSGDPFMGFLAQNSTATPEVPGNPTIIGKRDIFCENDSLINFEAASKGGTWSASCGNCLNAAGVFDPVAAGPGTHVIRYKVTQPCAGEDSFVVTVRKKDVKASFFSDRIQGTAPLAVTFTNTSTNARSYQWDLGNGNTSNNVNPGTIYPQGKYEVRLIARDSFCSDTAFLSIDAGVFSNLQAFNIFTPNGDGINDLFTYKHEWIKEIDLRVYNRWGEILYKSQEVESGWDGTHNGIDCPSGTYFFILKALGFDNKKYEYWGSVTLLR